MRVLVTGTAGFIGFHTAKRLIEQGHDVIGIDSINDYYDVNLKLARLEILSELSQKNGLWTFFKENLSNQNAILEIFKKHKPRKVINLAAQAGVRFSLENPMAYIESNIIGFVNILEACRLTGVEHLVYASTSSVYGGNNKLPFSEHHGVDHPLQLYAATKRSNELMAHSYSYLFKIPTTGLRFFSVYGPWGRPDMALFLFTKNIIEGKPIQVFNNGNHTRDFTYIDDIVEGILRVVDKPATPDLNWDSNNPDPATSMAPFRVFNIGNNSPIQLSEYIEAIENYLGKKSTKDYLPLQPGDVPDAIADNSDLYKYVGFKPEVPVREGMKQFIDWYRNYYKV